MSLSSTQTRLTVGWFAVVTTFVGVSLASGAPLTLGYGISLFVLGFLPAVIVSAIFRGAPAPAVTAGLYSDEHTRHVVVERLRRLEEHDRNRR